MFNLEKTLHFWVCDLLQNSGKTLKVEIVRPGAECSIQLKEGELRARVASDYLVIKKCKGTELIRKAGVKFGFCHDYRSLHQIQVTAKIRRFRSMAAKTLKVQTGGGPVSFLLRVDDFPSPTVPSEDFLKFHAAARRAGLPYLLAITPFLARPNGPARLTDREIEILKKCFQEGAVPALHGFTHVSRYQHIKSELRGMPEKELRVNLEIALETFEKFGNRPEVFVAPFNHYSSTTLHGLARYFSILCGGPESMEMLGYTAGPAFIEETLYLPSYRGAYDRVSSRLLNESPLPDSLPVPLTVHWSNGAGDQWRGMANLFSKLEKRVLPWSSMTERLKK